MNDLELLRQWRAEIPAPDAAQLAAGRKRLLAVIAGRPRSPWLVVRRPVIRFAAAAMAVAALGAALVLATQRSSPPAHATLAAQILERAALVRGERSNSMPSPHRWIYQYGVARGLRQPTQRSSNWERFDGRRTASVVDGRVVVYPEKDVRSPSGNPLRAYLRDPTPEAVYAAIASLPADPQRLLDTIDRAMRHGFDRYGLPALAVLPNRTRAEREFNFIAQLLWQDSQSGVVRGGGSLFRALSRLHVVSAQRGIRDALGRRAVGISDDRGAFQLLLSPRTYQVLGFRSVSTGRSPDLPNGRPAPKGTIVQSIATSERFVRRPGDR